MGRFVFQHEQRGGVVHLVSGDGGSVSVEEGLEGLGGSGGGDGQEGFHFFWARGVPFLEHFEEAGPVVDVFGGVHYDAACAVVRALFPFSRGAEEVDDLAAEVDDSIGVHAEIGDCFEHAVVGEEVVVAHPAVHGD